METPSGRPRRGRAVADSTAAVEASTPLDSAPSRSNSNTKRPTKAKAVQILDTMQEEDVVESDFDGNATMRAGQLSAAKRKHTVALRSEVVLTEAEFNRELERRCTEIASKLNDDCMKEVETLKETHNREMNELRSQLAVAGVVSARPQSSMKKWTFGMVCRYLIYQKVTNLNDGHSSMATNKSIHFDVAKEELALCLHCFAELRDPEECIFKKGRTGSFRHRKPKSDTSMYSKCVKPGLPNVNDENHYDCRHINGKDYLLFR